MNGAAPGLMARWAAENASSMIHFSTDYVFDGCSKTPYKEEDTPNPLSVYGKSKLEGEKALDKAGIPYLILRTSWVYSHRGKNFLLSIQRLAKEKDSLRIVNDQIGAPTWARSIAKGTHKILGQCLNQNWPKIKDPSLSGIFHLTCQGKTSWHGFAKEIINLSDTNQNIALQPIPTSEYPTPATRPKYSLLSNEKIKKVFSLEMPQWKDALKDCMKSK